MNLRENFKNLFGSEWKGVKSDWKSFQEALEFALKTNNSLEEGGLDEKNLDYYFYIYFSTGQVSLLFCRTESVESADN